ncbi:hypothetical protein WA538_001900 [Blastocystis sp. DL]
MKYVVGSLLFAIRLVPVMLLVILLLCAQLLSSLIIGAIPKHLYWSWVVSPICNLLLGVLGVLPIRVNYGESQKLRIRTEVNASEMSLSAIKSGDVIISNFTGYLQILVYAALASDRFGFINNQGDVIECGLLTALRYAMWPTPSFFTRPGKPLESLTGHCPLVLFAEDFPTNNRAVLQFVPLAETTYAAFPHPVHLLSMSMTSRYVPGAYLVGGPILHFLSLLLQTGVRVQVTWLCDRDLALLAPPVAEKQAKPKLSLQVTHLNAKTVSKVETKTEVVDSEKCAKYFFEVRFPELLAAMMQTQVVSLTKEDGFRFIEYYRSRGNKKQN